MCRKSILTALCGQAVTTAVEGRERFSVNVRYPRDLRGDPQAIGRVLVSGMDGAMVPLGQLATIRLTRGPATIRTENAQLAVYVYVDTRDADLGGYVGRARQSVQQQVMFPKDA
jgi:Cu(I)/Ag(I) efflux system membrane protein CusA/SilA